jgi:hypothetical protein
VEFIGDDGLPAFVDVDMAHSLLARLVQFGAGFERRPAIALRLIVSRTDSSLALRPTLR